MTQKTILQELLLPGLNYGAPSDLYIRTHETQVGIELSTESLRFRDGILVSFDTYFNGITVERWRTQCGIGDLALCLKGSGRFKIRFGLYRLGLAHEWLAEQFVTLAPGEETLVEMPFWPQLDHGLLYMSLEAEGEARLAGGHFFTTQAPLRAVKLGIVITHYNRKPFLLPALRRLNDGLLNDPTWAQRLHLFVVDNSQNVTPEEALGATVIPNANYGGSGGFTRGLLHVQDNGYSHCLFMDDDASCTAEAVRRAYMLLSYVKDERAAVTGAQLRETAPWQLHEAGARFVDGRWLARKHHLDMRDPLHLLLAERNDLAANYGGWWFFGFPIAAVRRFPYPFFVRGDDALFSLQNEFSLITMNGICSMAEDFWVKESPLTRYLGMRATMLLLMMNGQTDVKPYVKVFVTWFVGTLFSYNYASARSLLLAIAHVLEGPDFFARNLDMSAIRAEVNALTPSEKMQPIDISEVEVAVHPRHDPRWRRGLRWMTLNGSLLPGFLLKDKLFFQFKHFNATFREIFRHRRVMYYHEATRTGYIATMDRAACLSLLVQMVKSAWRFTRAFPRLREDYARAMPEMTSEAFWRKVYAAELQKE